MFSESILTRKLVLAIGAGLIGMQCGVLYAQDETESEEEADGAQLEVITVTATRNVTDLMRTPLAITALDSEALVRQNTLTLQDMDGMAPNIEFGHSQGDSGVQIGIRGVTSTNFTEIGDPAVGVHIDGIYSPRPQGALALMFDLDRVEILRGAQGTLFGRNSTAGVVNVVPARPDFDDSYGWSSFQLSNFNGKQFRSVYNLAVTENFALRGALMIDKRDGFIHQERDLTDRGPFVSDGEGGGNFTPDGNPDVDQRFNRELDPSEYYHNSNQWGARLTGLWRIAANHRLTLGYERFKNMGAGGIGMKDCDAAEGTRWACNEHGQWYALVNVPGKIDMTIDTLRALYQWNLNDSTDIEYRVGYALQQRYQQHDTDAGLHPLKEDVDIMHPWGNWGRQHVIDRANFTLESDFGSWVNELQFRQEFDRLNYVAGLFWLHEDNSIVFAQDRLVEAPWGMPHGNLYVQPSRVIDSRAAFAQADYRFTDRLTGTIGYRHSWDRRSDNEGATYGAWDDGEFAEYDFGWYYNGLHVPPNLGFAAAHSGNDLTLGMGPFAGPSAYPGPTINTFSQSWEQGTYRVGLQYEIDHERMVFSSLATGYRPGGFGDRFDTCGGRPCADPDLTDSEERFSYLEYDAERTRNFEIGYKGSHLNRRLNFSAVYFHTRYQDMHFTAMHAVGQNIPAQECPDWNPACDIVDAWKTENIGEATIQGLEIEFNAVPWDGGRINGFFSWMDSNVDSYPTFDDNWMCGYREEMGAEPCADIYMGPETEKRGRRILDVRGHRLPRTPKFTVGVNLSQDFDLARDLTLTPWLGVTWKDKQYFTVRNLDNPHIGDFQSSYTNVNASLRLASVRSDWHVEAYGTNLTNNVVKNWMGQGLTGGFTFNSFNPPRMYGIRFQVAY